MTRDELLAMRMPEEVVEVPWHGNKSVRVRGLTPRVADEVAKIGQRDTFLYDVHMVLRSVIDDEGRRMFTDDDAKLVEETVDPVVIQLLSMVAVRLSSATDAQVEIVKKNLPSRVAGNSGDSQSASENPTPTN